MIKAVLFDVDGVLYDSMPLHVKSWQAAFRTEKIKLPAKLVYDVAGAPDKQAAAAMGKLLKKNLSKKVTHKIAAHKVDTFNTYPKPKIIPGAKKFVTMLRNKGVKICLVTGSSQTKTVQRLEKDFKIKRDAIIIGKDVKHGKPHPEPYLAALRKLKVKASQAIVIEDAPMGIESAKRAGIKCLVINTAPYTKTELIKSGADSVFNNFADILIP